LFNLSSQELNEALSFFIAEVRKESGDNYKPNTLYEIIISIQHYLRQNGRLIAFMDDQEYQGLRSVLNSKMKELSRLGLGINTKKSEVITIEQEEILWSKGLLGESNPQQLLDTLLFLFGLHFALRAAQEHRNLRFGMNTQLSVKYDLEGKKYLQYIEDVSKTNQGGLDHRKVSPKMTRAYENSNLLRCPVRLYEKYIALRPKDGTVDAFYLRPKKMPCSDVWYCDSPVGTHTIQSTVKRL
ncbi:hypothetical protein LOTGIDRAFT_66203, partial [Lottia gigantea]